MSATEEVFDELDDVPAPGRSDASDVERIVADLESLGGWARPDQAVDLSTELRWMPHLVGDDGRLLHIQTEPSLLNHIARRLRTAHDEGRQVVVALRVAALFQEPVLVTLSDAHAHVIVLGEDLLPLDDKAAVPLLRAIASQEIRLPDALRRSLGRAGWARCANPGLTSAEKGRRLESLLGFLFSQVAEFRVTNWNLRTETEELDLVVQLNIAGSSGPTRCWVLPGSPFIVVEAKNWTSKVGQKEVSTLFTKVITKRSFVRIAFMVGASGFSEDAHGQVQKLSLGSIVFVMLGPQELQEWIDKGDPYLEDFVRTEMLR